MTSSAGMPPFIGRFRILRVLGSGAQSTVYAAFDPHLHREVALKALHLVGDQTEAATAMLHEARAVSRLSHPAIVPVFDAGEEGGQPYLVFEYVPGQTLAARLHITGSLPAERAVALLLPILEALAYTHEHQVVHRDLKPTNILIDTQGRARVMDFGIAVRQTSVGTTGADADAGGQRALQGTPAYMAPEYARQGIVSPLMDVYSAGLILYEMLCGERAIGEAHGFAALAHVAHAHIQLPQTTAEAVDSRLRAIVNRALAHECAERTPSMAALVAELKDWMLAPAAAEADPAHSAADEAAEAVAVERFMARMREQGDLPLIQPASLIAARASAPGELAGRIAQVLPWAQKLLRVANAPHYRQLAGGRVNTVAHALQLLGAEAVGHLSAALPSLAGAADAAQVQGLTEQYLLSRFSVTLAARLSGLPPSQAADAALAAGFHDYGRVLVLAYAPRAAAEIRRLSALNPGNEASAAAQVLGLPLARLGLRVAQAQGLPDAVAQACVALEGGARVERAPRGHGERIDLAVGLAAALADAARHEAPAEQRRLREGADARYGHALGWDTAAISGAVDVALGEVAALAALARPEWTRSSLVQRLLDPLRLSGLRLQASEEAPPAASGPNQGAVPLSALAGDDATVWLERGDQGAETLVHAMQALTTGLLQGLAGEDLVDPVLHALTQALGQAQAWVLLAYPPAGTAPGWHLGYGAMAFDPVDGGTRSLISPRHTAAAASGEDCWAEGGHTAIFLPLRLAGQLLGALLIEPHPDHPLRLDGGGKALLQSLRNLLVLALPDEDEGGGGGG
ncbi:MAG TPA: protein kinase [Burkholderiaceae bacterium]|nr:protein kinase [Burkholderiaceae bacterium]